MKRVALVLHFYQPPMQDLAVTKQVLFSSYLPVLKTIAVHPRAKVTLNISACLLQQLDKLKKNEFFDLIREVYAQGKIELLNGPAYHPILPLITRTSIERQFEETAKLYDRFLGLQPGRGIFPPELAMEDGCMAEMKRFGDYLLVDQTALDDVKDAFAAPVAVDAGEMRAYVNNRSVCDVLRTYPDRLKGDVLGKWIATNMAETSAQVIVSDVEVFGHHYEERIETLGQMFDYKELEFVRLQDLANEPAVSRSLSPSSWQHVPWDKHQTGAFWLWKNPANPLHTQYWNLARQIEDLYLTTYEKTDPLFRDEAAQHLDMGLSSCYPYWVSNWPWWHPDLVERGAQQLIKCARTILASREQKLEAEAVYHKFLDDLWKMHWSGQVEENYREFDLEREKLVTALPNID